MDTSKPKVLYFIEAHPIRNSFTEHLNIAKTLGPVLSQFAACQKIDLRIFANQYLANNLREYLPGISRYLIEPNDQEARAIENEFGWWNQERINRWVDMINGIGEPVELYCSILERLHAEEPIDVVVLWSENGGVRKFSEKHGVPTLHGELGPTRPPFLETFYFDSAGTNGNASSRFFAAKEFTKNYQSQKTNSTASEALSVQSWLIPSERILTSDETSLSLSDLPMYFDPLLHHELPATPYVFVAMQLADDLNTLLHSPYRTQRDFLDDAIKLISENGYHTVVKGHPGAPWRPSNLRSEVEAIKYIEDRYDNITIMDRDASIYRTLYTLSNARYSMSINSSLSFESLLLGVPTIILGDAVFDADRKLQDRIKMKPADVRVDFSSEIDALTSTYLNDVFVPKDVLLETNYLLNLIIRTLKPHASRSSFCMRDWYIFDMENPEVINKHRLYEVNGICIGRTFFKGKVRITRADREKITLSDGDTSLDIDAASPDTLIGYIDHVTVSENTTIVSGWCLEKESMKRPIAILAIYRDFVVQESQGPFERHDVCQAFPLAGEDALFSGFKFQTSNLNGEIGLDGLLVITEDLSYKLISSVNTVRQIGTCREPRLSRTWLPSFSRMFHR
ncbi:GT99 family glycosyltransferase N-terminal domain-containing protein [Nioella sp.]|uniref:GT99 family glycosyltransferase N-terminal domain-containing protein n=2 Tax=Nioella sp. TaxID=1912091 RepID=UPI003A871995